MIGRHVTYRQTIKVMWKCRHSSAAKKGWWIQENKTDSCLLTLCVPWSVAGMYHKVPGSVGTREGRCLIATSLPRLHFSTKFLWQTNLPLQGERRNFKISGVYWSLQALCNNTTEFFLGSSDTYHSIAYRRALRKHRFSLPQVSAVWN